MDLTCYLHPGWEPRIRPASSHRGWMDDAPESFPYRCLPLSIVNSHGWEVLSACGFEVEWNGGMAPQDVVVRVDPGAREHEAPVPLFGLGTVTIHIQGLFRTAPGWDLLVSGPPNIVKDGIAPLAGIIETDWSPYTFTMNWRLTRPGHVVRFEENEPCAFFFPVQRGAVAAMAPRFLPLDADPKLKAGFETWSKSRNAFQQRMRDHPPAKPTDKWQKLYYRGLMPEGDCPFPGHQAKLQVKEFANQELAGAARQAMARPVAPATARPAQPPSPAPSSATRDAGVLAKRDWLLGTQQRQRSLSHVASGVFRREGLSGQAFLDEYYAPGRPVVLAGAIEDWPARTKWTPQYLRDLIGEREVTIQAGRDGNADFERYKDDHSRRLRFDTFIDSICAAQGNNAYLTAYNGAANADTLAPLAADVGRLDGFLDASAPDRNGMIWIGPAGTFTPLHHDLTNNFFVQVVGRKQVIMAAAADTPNLYNDHHVFSLIRDVTDPTLDLAAFRRLAQATFHEIVLEPGEILYIPVGWWHQVRALDFSVSITFTNFLWPNNGWQTYPQADDRIL